MVGGRSCLIQEEAYLLGCYRYIELNPVRAGMVARPAEYRWSSYRYDAEGECSRLLDHHPIYLALDSKTELRQTAYRELFRHQIDPGFVVQIRTATNGNHVLGDSPFQEQVAAALGRRVSRGKSGRPSKRPVVESLALFDE